MKRLWPTVVVTCGMALGAHFRGDEVGETIWAAAGLIIVAIAAIDRS